MQNVSNSSAVAHLAVDSMQRRAGCSGPKRMDLELIGTMNRDLKLAALYRYRKALAIHGVLEQPFHDAPTETERS